MYYSGALDLVDDVPAYATNLAAAHVMLKDWPAALAAADRGLRMDASNPKAHYRRAQALGASRAHTDTAPGRGPGRGPRTFLSSAPFRAGGKETRYGHRDPRTP